ncbi:MAG: hypothetical protein ACLUQ6_02415, partial [Alistipes onderdonkii]
TPTQSGVTSNFSLTSRIPVAASDFIFVRMKLRVDKRECSLRIITYSDNLDQRGRWFVLTRQTAPTKSTTAARRRR